MVNGSGGIIPPFDPSLLPDPIVLDWAFMKSADSSETGFLFRGPARNYPCVWCWLWRTGFNSTIEPLELDDEL